MAPTCWTGCGVGWASTRRYAAACRAPAGERVERVLFALVANRALAPSSKLAAARLDHPRRAHRRPGPATTTPATGRWTGCTRCATTLEKRCLRRGREPANLEVDLLFFDTTSTYFELEEPDEPVARDEHGARSATTTTARTTATATASHGGVPHLRQVEGLPRRSAADRDRDGRHPRRDPGAGLVLARQHRRPGADPAGQGRHAGLDPVARSCGSPTAASPPTQPPLPTAGDDALHHRREAPLRLAPRSRPRCPARAATRTSPRTCGSRKSGSRETERFVICHNPEAANRDAAVREQLVAQLDRADRGHRQAQPTIKRGELRGQISDQARPEPLPAHHPRRAAPHRRREDQGRGEPRRQVPAALLRPAPVRRGHRAGLQATPRSRARLAGHEADHRPAARLPPARGTHPRPCRPLLARPAADPHHRDHHRPDLARTSAANSTGSTSAPSPAPPAPSGSAPRSPPPNARSSPPSAREPHRVHEATPATR